MSLGNLQVVKQLYAHEPNSLDCRYALVASDLPLLKWFKTINSPGSLTHENWSIAFYVAVERGDLETVQWLVNAFPDEEWLLPPGVNHPAVTKWLHDEHVNLLAMRIPISNIMQAWEGILDVCERLKKQFKLTYKKFQQTLATAKAKPTGPRARKRKIEEAGIDSR